jgi:NAD(P)-dependent dehydrogenase (short-subunit alcohol dehydrogenase family)
MLLADKVVIVSGIGPGLGVKLAAHAAREGARGVVVAARRTEGLDAAVQAIAETGADCEVLPQVTDIRDAEACARLTSAAAARFGAVDALLNNAVHHGPLDDIETAELDGWHEQYDTNVIGTLKMSRAVIEQMKTQPGGGAIVMVNTMGARMVPIVPEAGYCVSKAALAYATKKLAREVGRYGVRVNSIYPGFMWGVPVQNFFQHESERTGESVETIYARVAEMMALKRIVTDDEVARSVLFLASDYASAITGASVDANGGDYMP